VSSFALPLTRAQSARIRELFRDKRVRKSEGAFIIEGAKPVHDLLVSHPTSVQMLVMTEGYIHRKADQHRILPGSADVPCFRCLNRTFSSFSDVETPQGILAVVRQPRWDEEHVFAQTRLFGIYGESLQDPANVGAIIRTAAALGVDALWLTPESADVYNPKVVRATTGALLSLPIFITRDTVRFTQRGCAIFAAEAGGIETVKIETITHSPNRLIVALGNESRGLSTQTIKQAACRFTIPLSREIQSINVAATAAIVIHFFAGLSRKP
jgi:TrmH family RNA methyltransferase